MTPDNRFVTLFPVPTGEFPPALIQLDAMYEKTTDKKPKPHNLAWHGSGSHGPGKHQSIGESDPDERRNITGNVLILQVDRLGSGNMRSAIQDVFPDTHVTIVRSGADAVSSVQSSGYELVVLGLAACDIVWMSDLPRILKLLSNTPVLVISGRHAPRTFRMLNKFRSISIFDPVTQGPMDLRIAMEVAVSGRRYMSPSIQEILRDEREVKPELILSATEERVLSIIGDGSDDEEASQRLALALATLSTHRRNIMKKLDLHHRGELVRCALKHGYVTRTLDGSLVPGLVAILSQMEIPEHR